MNSLHRGGRRVEEFLASLRNVSFSHISIEHIASLAEGAKTTIIEVAGNENKHS